MADIHILGIPLDLGAGRRGVDMGPSALRLAKIADHLGALGHEVRDHGNVDAPVAEATANPNGLHYADAIAATCTAAYRRLVAMPAGAVPLTLGGDHAAAMATVAGAVHAPGEPAARTGVVWVDAHADLNTPDTSPSGNIHGMPLAHLLGMGDPRLLGIWGGGAVLEPRDVVFVGLRSVDPAEKKRIRDLGIRAFTMKEVDQMGIAAVASAALEHLADVDRLHVTFDADALDPSVAPGVGTPVPGGLGYREAHLLMELLADARRVTSVDLVEVNPILDLRNESARVMVEMAASLLGKKIL